MRGAGAEGRRQVCREMGAHWLYRKPLLPSVSMCSGKITLPHGEAEKTKGQTEALRGKSHCWIRSFDVPLKLGGSLAQLPNHRSLMRTVAWPGCRIWTLRSSPPCREAC